MRKGFTLTITPHGGGKRRSWSLQGGRLLLLRVSLVLAALIVLAAAATLAVGLSGMARAGTLQQRVAALQDSLAAFEDMAARLDSIELELEQIREIRSRIENLAGVTAPASADTL